MLPCFIIKSYTSQADNLILLKRSCNAISVHATLAYIRKRIFYQGLVVDFSSAGYPACLTGLSAECDITAFEEHLWNICKLLIDLPVFATFDTTGLRSETASIASALSIVVIIFDVPMKKREDFERLPKISAAFRWVDLHHYTREICP